MKKLCLVAAAVATCLVAPAFSQEFPTKTVRVTTPFPAGSGPEVVLRVVLERLSKKWGKPIVVDNKPGAAGFIAIESVKRLPADGHEWIQLDSAQMGVQPHLFKKLPYDLWKDFEPLTGVLNNYFFVTVPSTSPYKNVSDLVAAAKATPGGLNYGSWFIGSPGHLGAAMLETATGTKMNHVPFKEMTQLYTSVGSGEVPWAFGSIASTSAMYKAGKVKYLAIAANSRNPAFADVPTVAEAGGPAGFELSAWVALLAPKGVPAAISKKIRDDLNAVLSEPDIKARYAAMNYEPLPLSAEQFVSRVKGDNEKFGQVVRRLNISLD